MDIVAVRHTLAKYTSPSFDRETVEGLIARCERLEEQCLPAFQERVAKWCVDCFGETTARDVTERNWRFLEEALELVQSLGGNAADAHKLVDYVFGRGIGSPSQEVGGTMVTLACLVAANRLSMHVSALTELARIERPEIVEKIRRKHASKPHKSSLPGDYRYAVDDPAEGRKPDRASAPLGRPSAASGEAATSEGQS